MTEYREYEFIYLEPRCADCASSDERSWCQDDVWTECETCGKKPAKFKLVRELS